MHKSFYASGFLYSVKAHKILLLQSPAKDDLASSWTMLGGEGNEGEEAQLAFQRIVRENLDVDLKVDHIYPIYDYFHNDLDTTNYVFYAEVKQPQDFKSGSETAPLWVSFAETVKLLLSGHTKQDVIVGERVISAKWRVDTGQQDT